MKKPAKKEASKKAPEKKEEDQPQVDEDGDAVMSFETKTKKKKKPKGPPASFFKRQEEMKAKAQEKFEEIKAELDGGDAPPNKEESQEKEEEKAEKAPPKKEEPKKEPEKKQPEPKARPKTAAPPKAAKKSKIQVDDSGPGIAKEDAQPYMEEHCPPEILKQFEEAKWQDKKEAYSKLAAWVNSQDYSNELFEATFWFIKIKQKEWKEKNVNIVKGAIECINEIINEAQGMSKRAATIIIPFLSENVGDAKYKTISKENLLDLAELVTHGFVIKHMCKHISSAKNPNVLIENNVVMEQIINEFGTGGAPFQEMINISIICCDHRNVKVRNATISMLSTMYKHLGEGIRQFLKDIKDSTQKVIDKEFDKITPYAKGEFQPTRGGRTEEAKEEMSKQAEAESDPFASIPRANVAKEMGGHKMLAMINDDNWKKRKEAIDKLNSILENANMRILPDGLSELVGLLKVKMADSNKSVSKGFIEFVGKFAVALGSPAKQYAPTLVKPLLRCLSEKNTLVRQINLKAINNWSEAIGPENIINDIGKVIQKENPEIRSVLLDWILQHKESIPKSEASSLPKPLIACLQDKTPAIRSMTEKVIIEVVPFTGPQPFKKLVKDLKPAVQNSVKPIVDKCVAQADTGDVEMEEEKAPVVPKKEQGKKGPAKKASTKTTSNSKNASIKDPRPNTAQPMSVAEIQKRLQKKNPALGGKAKATEEPQVLQILDVGKKEKRNEVDKKKRWHPEAIRDDYVEKLKNQARGIFGDSTTDKMFSSDYKQQLKCLKLFKSVFDNEELVDPFCEVLDIVIKWAYIKSNEISNTQFLKELYNYFDELVEFLVQREYQFMEAEGTIFCLCLIEKIGVNNILKEKVKAILLNVGNSILFPPKKVFSILMKGLDSKSTKTTAECLECIAAMIQTHELEVIHDKDVKTICKAVDNPDNGIRQSALVACEEIYKITGEQFWTLTGKLTTKAEDIIKARLKANLGIELNSTPVEEKKSKNLNSSIKSPMVGRNNKMKASNLNKSLNKSLNQNNNLGSSIPLSDKSKKGIGKGRNDRNTTLNTAQSSANLGRKAMETEGGRKKESSVNRKLERISSSSRKQEALDNQLDRELDRISKVKTNNDEIVPEILLLEDNQNAELDENLDTVGKSIKQLKYGDLSGKVDALVIINEVVTKKLDETVDSVINNANFLIDAISKVLHDVFNKTPEKVPLKFGKYFISIVQKICSIPEVMKNVEEHKVLILVEQLLLKLLIPGLDSLGERGEGQAMFRNLNNTILRILENCPPTIVFVVFLTLLKKYKGYNKVEKLPGIIVKCLLKVTRIMDQLIDKLNIERVLLATHEYLLTKPASSSSKSDEVGIRITKTIVNELVKLKKEEIWDYYGGVDAHMTQDLYIKKWIEIILNSLSGGEGASRPQTAPSGRSSQEYTGGLSSEDHETLKSLIQETQCGNQFRADQAFKSIVDMLKDFPSLDIDAYLKANFPVDVCANVNTGIAKAKKRKMLTGNSVRNMGGSFRAPLTSGLKTPNKYGGLNATGGRSIRMSTNEKMAEYEEKRANLRKKFGSKRNIYSQENQQENDKEEQVEDNKVESAGVEQNDSNKLGSSIAAMNSSLTQKWKKINSQGLKVPSGLNHTVGGSNIGRGIQDRSTLDEDSNENNQKGENNANSNRLALQTRLNEVKARLGKMKKNHGN